MKLFFINLWLTVVLLTCNINNSHVQKTCNPKLLLPILFTSIGLPVFSQNTDLNILEPINKRETTFKNKYLELNASSTSALSISIPAGIAIIGFIKHDNELKKDALYMGGALLLSGIITRSVKKTTNRARPYEEYGFIVQRDDESGGLSFPSGHTSSAFCTATSLALRYPKWYVIAPSYIFAGSVAWARMYQGVHYPSDVLAGALIGAGSAWIGYKAQKWISGKKERKKRVIL
jgi:membrane-associated phospholipid phosphatase